MNIPIRPRYPGQVRMNPWFFFSLLIGPTFPTRSRELSFRHESGPAIRKRARTIATGLTFQGKPEFSPGIPSLEGSCPCLRMMMFGVSKGWLRFPHSAPPMGE